MNQSDLYSKDNTYISFENKAPKDLKKHVIDACCGDHVKIIEGALEIGMKSDDVDIFRNYFHCRQNPVTSLFRWENKEKSDFDLEAASNELHEIEQSLSSKRLGDYFMKIVLVSLKEEAGPDQHNWGANLLTLKRKIEYLRDRDAGNAKRKIQWKGTQKQLGELFVELKKKGWIEGFEYQTIAAAFTNAKSIQQVLKPGTQKEDYEPTYDQIFTTQYDPQFYGIKENPKKE